MTPRGCALAVLGGVLGWALLIGLALGIRHIARAEAPAPAVALLPPVETDWLTVADVEAVAAPTLADVIRAEAERHGLDPALVAAVIEVESGGDAAAVNGRSRGLMQLNDTTWPWLADQVGIENADPMDPAQNVRMGTWYLRWLINRYGLEGGLTAFNRGPAGAERWRQRHGSGASTYSRKVMEATGR